jgi:integrase/recombinase XerD
MSVSISIILDTRRVKKNQKYPVKLRVIHNRESRDYQTVYDLSEADFKKFNASRISDELSEIRKKLNDAKRGAENFSESLYSFEFYELESEFVKGNKLFKQREFKEPIVEIAADSFDYTPYYDRFSLFTMEHPSRTSLSFCFLGYIKKLIQQARIGSAINYLRSYRSLESFRGNVKLEQVTVEYLYQYEQWMLRKGNSKTSIGIVMCPLRAVMNEVIEAGILKRDKHYPFGRRKYQIPGSRNIKKSLTQQDVQNIYYYKSEDTLVNKGKKLWLFCYLANGLNVKDMIHLKYKNIDGEYLVIDRAKTERTARGAAARPITIYLTEDILEIIDELGNKDKSPNSYIFPMMRHGLTPLEQFDLLNHVRKIINDSMAQVRDALKIDKKVTSIVSRHSFSTHLKRIGASTEFIQEALGHTDKKTTENYLDSFENEVKKEFAMKLASFKKNAKESGPSISGQK